MEVSPKYDFSTDTSDKGRTYRLSRCVLLAHEDKIFSRSAGSIDEHPLGETKGDDHRVESVF